MKNISETEKGKLTDPIGEIRRMVNACIQCGTCTGSCPNEFAMDFTPRKMWRMVLMGKEDAVFQSRTFILCSACYSCTLRCPRGLPLTTAIAGLKRVAASRNYSVHKDNILFYKNFLASVRKHGRVNESEFMVHYFTQMKKPLKPFKFASLGVRLLARGKLPIKLISKGNGKLESIFRIIEQSEAGP